eukprot:scaffold2065_cov107-Cylindrotheca_fusiformis.AAC.7
MVDVQEIKEEETPSPSSSSSSTEQQSPMQQLPPSDERLLDVEEIEMVTKQLKRPGARMQLESLTKKLRKEAAALKRVEQQQQKTTSTPKTTETPTTTTTDTPTLATTVTSPPPPPILPKKKNVMEPSSGAPSKTSSSSSSSSSSVKKYTTVDRFSFDPGEYNDKFVTIYVPLVGVGKVPKEQISCHFTKDSFDLIVRDLKDGKSYRLFQDNLEKDVDIDRCKYIIKADKIIVKLAKIKGEYGSYDMWTKLRDPKKRDKKKNQANNDPMSSITDLMKDMYENGDDKMKKMIGETMLKQRNGELGKEDPTSSMDFGDDI